MASPSRKSSLLASNWASALSKACKNDCDESGSPFPAISLPQIGAQTQKFTHQSNSRHPYSLCPTNPPLLLTTGQIHAPASSLYCPAARNTQSSAISPVSNLTPQTAGSPSLLSWPLAQAFSPAPPVLTSVTER